MKEKSVYIYGHIYSSIKQLQRESKGFTMRPPFKTEHRICVEKSEITMISTEEMEGITYVYLRSGMIICTVETMDDLTNEITDSASFFTSFIKESLEEEQERRKQAVQVVDIMKEAS